MTTPRFGEVFGFWVLAEQPHLTQFKCNGEGLQLAGQRP